MKRYVVAQKPGQLCASGITYPKVEHNAFCQEHTWISSVLFTELAHNKYLWIDLVGKNSWRLDTFPFFSLFF